MNEELGIPITKPIKKEKQYFNRIMEETGLTIETINTMVKEKIQELKGLINEEGALFIVAKELGCELGNPKTEEEQINEEILELQEEIQEENKEFLDVVKTKEYLIFYNALKRALRDTTIKIEIVNSENISRPPGEKSSAAEKKEPKSKSESLKFENIVLVDQTEKAYKFRNEEFEICWFAKKGVKYNESTKELEVLGWWVDFVEKNDEAIEFKKEK